MRTFNKLILTTVALAATLTPVAHADSLVTSAPGARNLVGAGGYLAWSVPTADGHWRLAIRTPAGTVSQPNIPAFDRPAQPSIGSNAIYGPQRKLVAVYARAGDVYELDLKTGAESKLTKLSSGGKETLAAINLGQYVVARRGQGPLRRLAQRTHAAPHEHGPDRDRRRAVARRVDRERRLRPPPRGRPPPQRTGQAAEPRHGPVGPEQPVADALPRRLRDLQRHGWHTPVRDAALRGLRRAVHPPRQPRRLDVEVRASRDRDRRRRARVLPRRRGRQALRSAAVPRRPLGRAPAGRQTAPRGVRPGSSRCGSTQVERLARGSLSPRSRRPL